MFDSSSVITEHFQDIFSLSYKSFLLYKYSSKADFSVTVVLSDGIGEGGGGGGGGGGGEGGVGGGGEGGGEGTTRAFRGWNCLIW